MKKRKNEIKESFTEITKPLRETAKKNGLKESDMVDLVHRYRAENKKAIKQSLKYNIQKIKKLKKELQSKYNKDEIEEAMHEMVFGYKKVKK